jgi:hypothetical protein
MGHRLRSPTHLLGPSDHLLPHLGSINGSTHLPGSPPPPRNLIQIASVRIDRSWCQVPLRVSLEREGSPGHRCRAPTHPLGLSDHLLTDLGSMRGGGSSTPSRTTPSPPKSHLSGSTGFGVRYPLGYHWDEGSRRDTGAGPHASPGPSDHLLRTWGRCGGKGGVINSVQDHPPPPRNLI